MYKQINDVPLSICSQVLSFLYILQSNNKETSVEKVQVHFNKSKNYIQNAIGLLKLTEILIEENSTLNIDKHVFESLSVDETTLNAVIINRITKLPPFIQYCTFLTKGKSGRDAAKLVCTIYEISKKPELISKIFDKWIKIGGVVISPYILNKEDFSVSDVEQSTIEARIFLSDLLGDNFKQVNPHSIDDFIEAILTYQSDPKKSINDLGRGLEDFFRLDFDKNIDLSKCNGLGQISTTLFNLKVIHAKHNHILNALAGIRSMGDAHGVDKNSTERWKIHQRSAFASVLLGVQTINSLIAYQSNKSLEL